MTHDVTRHRRRLLLLGLVAASAVSLGAAPPAAAESLQPVTTVVNGDAVDAHDGEIRRFGNRYYLYGTRYGCGYEWQRPDAPFCGFASYSSTDLVHWRDEGPLFDASTSQWQQRCNGNTYGCYRPHVAFNAATGNYVLWINSYDIWVGFHVFTSNLPTGPFVEQPFPHLAVTDGVPPGLNNGDHDLFADDDGTAYLVFTIVRRAVPTAVSWSPSRVAVEVGLDVAAGDRLALVVRSAATRGCYGMAYNDADPCFNGGGGLYRNDSGTTWREETGRDLRIDTTVAAARDRAIGG